MQNNNGATEEKTNTTKYEPKINPMNHFVYMLIFFCLSDLHVILVLIVLQCIVWTEAFFSLFLLCMAEKLNSMQSAIFSASLIAAICRLIVLFSFQWRFFQQQNCNSNLSKSTTNKTNGCSDAIISSIFFFSLISKWTVALCETAMTCANFTNIRSHSTHVNTSIFDQILKLI